MSSFCPREDPQLEDWGLQPGEGPGWGRGVEDWEGLRRAEGAGAARCGRGAGASSHLGRVRGRAGFSSEMLDHTDRHPPSVQESIPRPHNSPHQSNPGPHRTGRSENKRAVTVRCEWGLDRWAIDGPIDEYWTRGRLGVPVARKRPMPRVGPRVQEASMPKMQCPQGCWGQRGISGFDEHKESSLCLLRRRGRSRRLNKCSGFLRVEPKSNTGGGRMVSVKPTFRSRESPAQGS